jgi:hypothetical protein
MSESVWPSAKNHGCEEESTDLPRPLHLHRAMHALQAVDFPVCQLCSHANQWPTHPKAVLPVPGGPQISVTWPRRTPPLRVVS